jgi:hypothetical protein
MAPNEGDASWIAFLGNGEIEGSLELDKSIGFWGARVDMEEHPLPEVYEA